MKLLHGLAGLTLALTLGTAFGQTAFPTKPIRLVVGAPPGGAPDTVARIVAQSMNLGQAVIVDNRNGAAQMIAAENVVRSAADGTTLLLASQTLVAVSPILYHVTRFDVSKDFAAVALIGSAPLVLVVNPSVKAHSVKELIALAKAHPGDMDIGSGGVGTTPYMAGALFAQMTGIKLTSIPYAGEQAALTEMMGGRLPIMFFNASTAIPYVTSGRLRGLAVTGKTRLDKLPALPTVAEAGVPGYETETWLGIIAPAATPRDVVQKINGEVIRVLALPGVKQKLNALGFRLSNTTPDQFGSYIRAEQAKWSKLIQDTGIKVE